jgi:hypothetical protein
MADSVPGASAADDLDAAKVIAEKLKDIPRDRHERILRWVAESLGIVSSSKPAPAPITPPAEPRRQTTTPEPPPVPRRSADIRSFVAEKQPQTDIQYVTVAAYFYRFEAPEGEQRATIDADFAQQSTRLAGRERLINPKSTLNNAKRQGYLNSRDRGQFEISTVGENLVVRGLPSGEAPRRRGGPSPRTGPRKKAAGRKKR